MKTHRILTLAAGLVVATAVAATAAGISLEVGATAYDFNALSAAQSRSSVITSNANFSPDPYVNGSYTLALNDATKLKLGLMAEDMMGTISPSFVQILRAEPYADLSLGALSARVSFPLYLLGYDTTNDPTFAEIKYILDKVYKGISLSTKYASTNTFFFTNYENVAYKISFDKTTALTLSASTEIGISPLWIYDVKPQVSLLWGPLQLDVKESIYFADAATTPSFSDSAYATRFFTDPKLTFNFASLGVSGLKAYVAASIYTANANAAGVNWADGTTFVGGAGNAAFGSSITPGVSYGIGPFYVEAAFKYSNYDDGLNDGITKKNPTFDPSLKVAYTFSF